MIIENNLYCESCKNSFDKELVRRKCSNCFACTGCEIYFCPFCNRAVVITLPKKMSLNNDNLKGVKKISPDNSGRF